MKKKIAIIGIIAVLIAVLSWAFTSDREWKIEWKGTKTA